MLATGWHPFLHKSSIRFNQQSEGTPDAELYLLLEDLLEKLNDNTDAIKVLLPFF